MVMLLQLYVESNESSFVRLMAVNKSQTAVYINDLPGTVSNYLVQVSAYNSVSSGPRSDPLSVGLLRLHRSSVLFVTSQHFYSFSNV